MFSQVASTGWWVAVWWCPGGRSVPPHWLVQWQVEYISLRYLNHQPPLCHGFIIAISVQKFIITSARNRLPFHYRPYSVLVTAVVGRVLSIWGLDTHVRLINFFQSQGPPPSCVCVNCIGSVEFNETEKASVNLREFVYCPLWQMASLLNVLVGENGLLWNMSC